MLSNNLPSTGKGEYYFTSILVQEIYFLGEVK